MKIDSILNNTIKVLLVSVICITLIIGALFIFPPVYALDEQYPIRLPEGTYDNLQGNSLILNTTNNEAGTNERVYRVNASTDSVYVFFMVFNGNMYAQFVSLDSFTLNYDNGSSSSSTSSSQYWHSASNSYVQRVERSVTSSSQINSYNSNIPIYSGLDAGISAFLNMPQEQLSFANTITIKPGYAAYIITEGGSVTLTAYQNDLSAFSQPLWLTRSRIALGVERPASGYVLDSDFGSLLNWQKDVNYKTNIFGQSHYSVVTYNDLPSDGSFVAIYNPLYSSFSTNQDNDYASPVITASFSNCGGVVQYPIKSSFNGNDQESTSTSGYQEYYIAIPTTNGAITESDYLHTTDGGTTSGPALYMDDYGDNEPPVDSVHSINDMLKRIISLLEAPIEHIRTLYSSAVAFFTSLTMLWSWLPPEVVAIISSALIVLVVIGAIKFLWK